MKLLTLKRISLICLAIVTLCPEANAGELSRSLEGRLQTSLRTEFREKYDDEAFVAVKKTLPAGGEDECWGIIQLYRWDRWETIRLQWWVSEDRLNRLLALFCMFQETTAEVRESRMKEFNSYAQRFSEKESNQRINEIKECLDMIDSGKAKAVYELLKKE